MNTIDSVKAARRSGVPLIIIRTADPIQAIKRLSDAITNGISGPMIQWDVVRGAMAVNEQTAEILAASLRDAGIEQKATNNPTKFICFIDKLPNGSIAFMLNLHRFCGEDINVIQSMLNARDKFKSERKTIIGLVPHITLPAELSQDVLVLDEPLPTDTELKSIAEDIYNSAQLTQPENADLEKIVDATLGLAAFPAEQAMAMSITKNGMDITELWQRKRSLIAQTPGLSVVSADQTFDDIAGVENIKLFLSRIMNGTDPPRCFVFIDEGEKAFAGSAVGSGDTSGVSQGFVGTTLTEMQDNNYTGGIFIGFPGSAKSMVSKCAGATYGVPTIQVDFGAMKNSLVGASEAAIRKCFAVIKAISQGRAFFIMSCNGIATLPPELKRRFRAGLWFFDFPTKEERTAIWNLYLRKYAKRLTGLDLMLPSDENWTGAEISVCVDTAYKLHCSLVEAASYIVPTYQSMGHDSVQKLRQEASGRFISASYPGPYRHDRAVPVNTGKTSKASASRTIDLN